MKGNFKVRCIRGYRDYTTSGKVYEVVNGKLTYDNGGKCFGDYYSVDELNENMQSQFELVTENKEIAIRQKGRKVIAVMTEDGKHVESAKAKCSPSDEFDFEIGARLAFSRLMGEDTILVVNPNEPALPTFDWEAFKQGKFAVHCDTEEKAKAFLNECDNWGIRWENINKKASEFCPRQATYFEYKTGFGGLLWGVKDYFERNGYAVTEYAPTVREVKRPAKVGEWVKIVNARYVPQTDGKDDYKNGDILQVVKYDGYNYEHTKRAYYKNARNKYADGCEYVVLENCQPEAKPFFSQSTIDEISRYTDKELINELSRRWEDKQ